MIWLTEAQIKVRALIYFRAIPLIWAAVSQITYAIALDQHLGRLEKRCYVHQR